MRRKVLAHRSASRYFRNGSRSRHPSDGSAFDAHRIQRLYVPRSHGRHHADMRSLEKGKNFVRRDLHRLPRLFRTARFDEKDVRRLRRKRRARLRRSVHGRQRKTLPGLYAGVRIRDGKACRSRRRHRAEYDRSVVYARRSV